MSTYHYFVSIAFLDFYNQCFRFFTSYGTCNNLFQGIVKTHNKPIHVFNLRFVKVVLASLVIISINTFFGYCLGTCTCII